MGQGQVGPRAGDKLDQEERPVGPGRETRGQVERTETSWTRRRKQQDQGTRTRGTRT